MSQFVFAPVYWGFSAWTVSGTSPVYPLTGLSSATVAQLTFEGSACRFRMDGATAGVNTGHSATSGSGHLVSAGAIVLLQGMDVLNGFNLVSTVPTANVMASWGGF